MAVPSATLPDQVTRPAFVMLTIKYPELVGEVPRPSGTKDVSKVAV